MALGEIEVRLNAGKYKARINANDLQATMMQSLQLAKSADEITTILDAAKAEAANQKASIKKEMDNIIADAEAMAE